MGETGEVEIVSRVSGEDVLKLCQLNKDLEKMRNKSCRFLGDVPFKQREQQ